MRNFFMRLGAMSAFCTVIAVVGLPAFLAGRYLWPKQSAPAASTTAPAQPAPRPTTSTIGQRNIVWQVFSEPTAETVATPEGQLGLALGLLLHPKQIESRPRGMTMYFTKVVRAMSDEQKQAAQTTFTQGQPAQMLELIRTVVAQDAGLAVLAQDVLRDTDRINRFMNEQPVPLEAP